jgi:hypothetical protein
MQQSWQRLPLLLSLLCATFCGAAAQETPLYRDTRAPVEQRVADLLSRMSLEEKVAQLEGTWQNTAFANGCEQGGAAEVRIGRDVAAERETRTA